MPKRPIIAAVLLVSCQATTAATDPTPAPAAPAEQPLASASSDEPKVAAAAPSVPNALAVVPPGGPTGPLSIRPKDNGDGTLPHVPAKPDAETMLSHVLEFGWAKEGDAFGFCYDDLDIGTCEVYTPAGEQTESLRMDETWKTWKTSVGGITVGPTDWAYPDVTITWREKKKRVEVGARVGEGRGKPDVVRFPHFDEDWPEAMGMLEALSVSPDGGWIALIGHEGVSEVHNEFYVEFRRPQVFAAAAYGARGFRSLKAGEYDEAATWFRKATVTDGAWKHPYNLACALSRAESDDTRAALEEAVRRGGDAARTKAKTDADLEYARGQSWFAAALGG